MKMNLVEIVRYLLSDLYRKYRKKYDISISIEELFRDLIESVIDRDQEYFIEGNEVFLIRKDQERLESQSFISKNDYYIALKYLKSQEIISFSDIHHPDTKITINLNIIHLLFKILAGGCLLLSVSTLMLGLVSLLFFYNTHSFLILLGIISLILSFALTFLIWFYTAISMAQTMKISLNLGVLMILIPSIILILIMIF